MKRIYLDYNATTPVMPSVAAVIGEMLETPLNASSIHAEGRKARSVLESSRRAIAEAIGAFPAEVIFTGSGTESNNWIFYAFAGKPQVISAVEHSSANKAAADAVILPVTKNGAVDMAKVEALLPNEPGFLVSVMLANNETGVIQPVADIAALAHARGGLLHCDAAQALGKVPVDFNALQCDFLTLCAHKMGGPVGAAALVAKNNVPLKSHSVGGSQEFSRRAGTENVAAIAGFAEAVNKIDLTAMQKLGGWMRQFEAEAKKAGAVIHGEAAERLPNTTNLSMRNMSSQTQVMLLDLEGIAVSSGSACTSGKVGGSHVHAAMGMDADIAANAIRVSGGWGTTEEEVNRFTQAWLKLAAEKE